MSTFSSTVLTLYRRDLGEADHLVVFLSSDRGKIRAKSRGTHRPGSKLAAAIQPFVLSNALFAEGKSLTTLCQAEVLEAFRSLREDLLRWAHASYLAELVDRGLPEGQPAESVFALLLDCLRAAETSPEPAPLVSQFEVKLMAELGFHMGLTHCMACQSPVGEQDAFWSPAQGGVLCRACGRMSREASPIGRDVILTLRRMSANPFGEHLDVGEEPASSGSVDIQEVGSRQAASVRAQAWVQLRRAAHDFVQYHMEWEFRSWEFLRSMEGITASSYVHHPNATSAASGGPGDSAHRRGGSEVEPAAEVEGGGAE